MALSASEIRVIAENAWLIASDHMEKHGTATRRKDRDGWTGTVKGGVKRFILAGAKEAKYGKLNSNDVTEVREFLKRSVNIVYVGGGGPGYSNLFVAKDWSEQIGETEAKVLYKSFTPRDTGQKPGGESGEVVESSAWDELVTNPLGADQAELVTALARKGGKVTYDQIYDGLHNIIPGSDAAHRAAKRGLIVTKLRSPRRYECMKLTSLGWFAANNIHMVQTAEIALEWFLGRVGGVFEMNPGDRSVSTTLGPLLHRESSNIMRAIRKLEEDGIVKTDAPDGGYPKRIELVTSHGEDVVLEAQAIVDAQAELDQLKRDFLPHDEQNVQAETVHPATAYEDLVYTSDAEVNDARIRRQGKLEVNNIELDQRMQVDDVDLTRILNSIVELANKANAPKPDLRIEKVQKVCEDVEKGERTLLDAITEISRIVG